MNLVKLPFDLQLACPLSKGSGVNPSIVPLSFHDT